MGVQVKLVERGEVMDLRTADGWTVDEYGELMVVQQVERGELVVFEVARGQWVYAALPGQLPGQEVQVVEPNEDQPTGRQPRLELEEVPPVGDRQR